MVQKIAFIFHPCENNEQKGEYLLQQQKQEWASYRSNINYNTLETRGVTEFIWLP